MKSGENGETSVKILEPMLQPSLPAMESEAKAGSPQQPRGRTVFPACLAPEGKESRPPNAASSHMGAKYGAATSLRSCCVVLGDQDGWGTNRLSKAESILGTGMSQNLSRGRRHACYTNARMEGLNSLFQAARARARGYRNNRTFITMIYMIASPAGSILKSI